MRSNEWHMEQLRVKLTPGRVGEKGIERIKIQIQRINKVKRDFEFANFLKCMYPACLSVIPRRLRGVVFRLGCPCRCRCRYRYHYPLRYIPHQSPHRTAHPTCRHILHRTPQTLHYTAHHSSHQTPHYQYCQYKSPPPLPPPP